MMAPMLALAVAGALFLAAPSAGIAQVPGDSAGAAETAADSARRAAGDTGGTRPPGAPLPSGTPADSGAASGDRVPPAAEPGAATPGSPAPANVPLPINVGIRAPTDTTLARACVATPAGREAPGLLTAVFRAGTSDKDKAAAAKAVGGSLAGTNGMGEEYVRLEVGSGPLAAVADRLIRQDPVMRVSPAPCPRPPAPPAANTNAQP